IATTVRDVFPQSASGVDPPHVQAAVGQCAKRRAAADIGDLEPDTLLGPDAHDGHVTPRRAAQTPQCLDRHQAGHDTRGAIEISTVWDGIEMRTDDDPFLFGIEARQGHIKVRRRVPLDRQPHRRRRRRAGFVRALFSWAVGVARHTRIVVPVTAEVIEQAGGELPRCDDGGADACRLGHDSSGWLHFVHRLHGRRLWRGLHVAYRRKANDYCQAPVRIVGRGGRASIKIATTPRSASIGSRLAITATLIMKNPGRLRRRRSVTPKQNAGWRVWRATNSVRRAWLPGAGYLWADFLCRSGAGGTPSRALTELRTGPDVTSGAQASTSQRHVRMSGANREIGRTTLL